MFGLFLTLRVFGCTKSNVWLIFNIFVRVGDFSNTIYQIKGIISKWTTGSIFQKSALCELTKPLHENWSDTFNFI